MPKGDFGATGLMPDWAHSIFDASDFVTRDQCGDWGNFLPAAYRVSNAVTAIAYFLIPASLGFLYAKRRSILPTPWALLLFVAFIGLCGLGHVADIMSFYWPAYRLFTALDFLTAVASAGTAAVLPVVVANVLSLPSPEEHRRQTAKLELEAATREALLRERESHNERLRVAANEMRQELEAIKWKLEVSGEYEKMREILHKIRGA